MICYARHLLDAKSNKPFRILVNMMKHNGIKVFHREFAKKEEEKYYDFNKKYLRGTIPYTVIRAIRYLLDCDIKSLYVTGFTLKLPFPGYKDDIYFDNYSNCKKQAFDYPVQDGPHHIGYQLNYMKYIIDKDKRISLDSVFYDILKQWKYQI